MVDKNDSASSRGRIGCSGAGAPFQNPASVPVPSPPTQGHRDGLPAHRFKRSRCAKTAMADAIPFGTDAHTSIYESELRAIAANAVAWGHLETGGELFGLYTRGGRIVILYATGPGETSSHEASHFEQDLDQFHLNNTILWERFGIQFVGNQHSHADLGWGTPSSDDARNTTNLANRNGLSEVIQIVVTWEYCEENEESEKRTDSAEEPMREEPGGITELHSSPGATSCAGRRQADRMPLVRLRAFLHSGLPSSPKCEEAAIRLLSGTSPIRRSVEEASSADREELSVLRDQFPLDRIRWTTWNEPPAVEASMVSWLLQEADRLPREAQETLSVTPEENCILVQLRFFDSHWLHLAYNLEDQECVARATAVCGEEEYDLTDRIQNAGSALGLAEVYALCWRAVASQLITTCETPSKFVSAVCDRTHDNPEKENDDVEPIQKQA